MREPLWPQPSFRQKWRSIRSGCSGQPIMPLVSLSSTVIICVLISANVVAAWTVLVYDIFLTMGREVSSLKAPSRIVHWLMMIQDNIYLEVNYPSSASRINSIFSGQSGLFLSWFIYSFDIMGWPFWRELYFITSFVATDCRTKVYDLWSVMLGVWEPPLTSLRSLNNVI